MLVLGVECGIVEMIGSIRVDDSDTTLEAIVEGALSTTSSKNLGLDNSIITTCAH
jgi:hypothetical protein